MRERLIGAPALPAVVPVPATSTAEKILNVLARVPADHHYQLRAWSMLRGFQVTTLKMISGMADRAEAEALVEDCRRSLLELLVELVEPIDGPAARKGGAA